MERSALFVILILGMFLVSGCVPKEERLTEEVLSAEEAIPKEILKPQTADDCEKIINNARKDRCYIDIAIKTKDSSLCEKITGYGKDGCYVDVALETKDINLCEKITHDIQKNTCNAIVTNDANECEGLTRSSWKDQCYFNVARRIEDTILCEKITDNIQKSECYAVITKEANICEKITKSSRKDGCYREVAIETKDASPCEKITSSTLKRVCYSHIAGITMDSSLCEKSSDKGPCYADIAVETKDTSLCEKITGREKDMCYWSVALGIEDARVCEKITDMRIKDTCYISIAEKTKDISLCEKITDSAIKEDCVEKAEVPSAEEEIEAKIQKYNKVLYWTAIEITPEIVPTKEKYDFSIYSVDLNGENKEEILEGSRPPFPFDRNAVKVSPSGKIVFLEEISRLFPTNEMYLWIADLEGDKKKIVDIAGDSMITQKYPFVISDDGKLVAYSIRTASGTETPFIGKIEKRNELFLINSDGTNSRKIQSSKATGEFNKTSQQIVSSTEGEELIPLKFSEDNKKLFAVSETSYAQAQNDENCFTIIDLETGERKDFDLPRNTWERILISPDEKKIITWDRSFSEKLNKIYLVDLEKNTIDTLTEDKNIGLIGWLSNEEIIYISQNEIAPSSIKICKKFNIDTKEKINLFETTDDIRLWSGLATNVVVDKKRLLYQTGGHLSTPPSLSELFVIDLDGTNKIKLESVEGGLTIIGLIY